MTLKQDFTDSIVQLSKQTKNEEKNISVPKIPKRVGSHSFSAQFTSLHSHTHMNNPGIHSRKRTNMKSAACGPVIITLDTAAARSRPVLNTVFVLSRAAGKR